MATAVYRLDQVGQHQTRDSCWIVIEGKVYDVTEYIDQHPGGDREILNEAGTDATLPFAEVMHSSDAKEILETLRIGVLHPDDVRALSRKNGMTTWKKIIVLAAVPLSLGLLVAFLSMRKK